LPSCWAGQKRHHATFPEHEWQLQSCHHLGEDPWQRLTGETTQMLDAFVYAKLERGFFPDEPQGCGIHAWPNEMNYKRKHPLYV
jgi:hypothetical protein